MSGGGGGGPMTAFTEMVGGPLKGFANVLGFEQQPKPTLSDVPRPKELVDTKKEFAREADLDEMRRRLIASGRSRSLLTGAGGAPGQATVGKRKLLGE